MNIECELMRVEAYDYKGDRLVRIIVPAFTRTPIELEAVVSRSLTSYLMESVRARSGVSLADFAFKLMAEASEEPTIMSAEVS